LNQEETVMSEPRTIDARAMEYPMPVMMAAEALKDCGNLTVFVGDIFTVEALTRLAGDNLEVGVAQKDGCFAVVFQEKEK